MLVDLFFSDAFFSVNLLNMENRPAADNKEITGKNGRSFHIDVAGQHD